MSTETVTVALKLPHGVRLRIDEMVKVSEPTRDGGWKDVPTAQMVDEIVLNGWWYGKRRQDDEDGTEPAKNIRGAYGLTPGVDKDKWERWLAANKDSQLVKSGLVFAHVKPDAVQARAKEENKDKRSGAEPLDTRIVQKGDRMAHTDARIQQVSRNGNFLIERAERG